MKLLPLLLFAQAQPLANNRPQPPEALGKEFLDGLRELTAAIKAIPTSITIQTSWDVGPNTVLSIGFAGAALVLCVLVLSVAAVLVAQRRQA